MRNYRNYDIWHLSMDITTRIYSISSKFPSEEKFSLTNQIRRAAVSVSSNIAEGCSRTSDKAFNQFLKISLGSLFEIETQLLIAENLNFIEHDEDTMSKINHLRASLISLITKLEGKR